MLLTILVYIGAASVRVALVCADRRKHGKDEKEKD